MLRGSFTLPRKLLSCPLPLWRDIYNSHCLSRASNILKSSSHPGYQLFELMPSVSKQRVYPNKSKQIKRDFIVALGSAYPQKMKSLHCNFNKYLACRVNLLSHSKHKQSGISQMLNASWPYFFHKDSLHLHHV